MILYFADRLMNIIGTASTNLPKSIVITNDAKTEDVDSGASAFECELSFDEHNRAKLEEITEVGNYLLRSDKGENEFYTIIDCEIDTKRQTAYIYAEDAGLDLLNDIIEPFEAGDSYEISYYVERTAKDAGWEIGVNELEGVSRKLKFADEQTGTARLLSIAKEFNDCEISFSFEVKGLQVTRKLINIYEQRGKDTDIQLRLNKQIDSIVTKKTINNLATALKARGSTPADSDSPITLLGYEYPDDGDFYVDGDVLKSREALKQWERYLWKGNDDEQTAGHIVKTFSYDTTSQAVLCEKAIEELKKIRDMEVNYEIEIVELPESARVGDRVNVIDEAGKLYLSTRLLKLVTSVTKQSYKATLGENFLKGSGIEAKVTDLAQQFAAIAKSRVFYTWIAYADDENGTGITTEPDGKAYIGIAANKTTEAVDISDPSVFTWSKIKGEDGKGGEYFHVRYSPYADGHDMTEEPEENTMYMGTCSTSEEEAPTDNTLYTWVQIRGADGKSVSTVENYYMVTDKNSGVTNEDLTQWKLNTIDELTEEKPYLWNFERTIYSDDNFTDSTPALIGNFAKDGEKGVGIQSIEEWYGLSNDENTPPAANAWSQDLPTMTPEMRFLWNYEVINYTKGDPVTTEPLIIGVYGEKGEQGEPGVSIDTVTEYYARSTSSTSAPGDTSFDTSVPTLTATYKYLWNYEVITYTGGKKATTTPKTVIGVFGVDGKGISSITEYYLATSLSSGVTTSTSGWKTTPQTTTSTNKYLWNYEYIVYTDSSTHTTAPIVIGVHGEKGDKGDGIATVKNYYLASSSASGVTTSTSGWTEAVQTTTASKKYLWNYEEVSYTGSTLQPTKTEPCIIGVYSADGKGISSVTEYYLATSLSSGVTTSTSGWTTTVQTLTATNKYLWNYEVISYTVGNPTTTTPVIIGTYGEKGDTGKSISGVTNYYLASSSSSGVTTSTSGWTEAVQTPTKDKKYLWNYEKVTYSEGSPTYTTPCIIGNFAEEGKEGVSISSVTEYYAKSSSSTSAPADSSFGTSVPALDATNKYLWNYEKIEYTGGKTATYTPKCVIGVFGKDGKGISSTAITYQAHSSGTSTPTGTWSSGIPSVSAGSYLWTRTVITYTDGSTSTSYSVAQMGLNGSPGKGIKSTSVTYQAHSSGTSTPTGTWLSYIPTLSEGQYLWTKTVITYTDDTTSTSYCVGMKGATGNGIKSTSITYQSSNSGTTTPTGTWLSYIPTVSQGDYLWTKTVITYTDNSTATSYSVGRMGADGQPGKDGQNLYAESSTAQGTSPKIATLKTGSLTSLTTGVTVTVKFTNANTSSAPYMNVASTGSKQIKWNKVTPSSSNPFYWAAGTVMTFVFDGTYWVVVDVGATKMDLTSSGLVVGNYSSSGTLANNVLIGPSDISIRNNTTVYASFGANTIYLGKENSSATINLCNGAATMNSTTSGALVSSRFLINGSEEIALSALNRVGQYASWDNGAKRADALINVQSRSGSSPQGFIQLHASTGTYSGGSISYTKTAYIEAAENALTLGCNGVDSYSNSVSSYIRLNTNSTTIDVSGQLSTTTHIQMPNGAYLYGKNSSGSVRALIGYTSSNYIHIGDTNHGTNDIRLYGKPYIMNAGGTTTNLRILGIKVSDGNYKVYYPDGDCAGALRTPDNGIVPGKKPTTSDGTTTYYSSIGSSSEYFNNGYINNIYTNSITLPNEKYITGKTTGGTALTMLHCSKSDNIVLGYGGYENRTAHTDIYGNKVRLWINSQSSTTTRKETLVFDWYDSVISSLRPETNGTTSQGCALGTTSYRYYGLFAARACNTSSDRRLKTNITPLGQSSTSTFSLRGAVDVHSELFDRLKPVQYNFIDSTDNRIHYGLIAQDIAEAMDELGIGEDELDLVHHTYTTDPETGEEKDEYSMVYNNLIAMLIHEVQKLKTRVNELENPQTDI